MNLNFGKFNNDNDCSGPRPPVPGKESRKSKMTEHRSDHFRESPPPYIKWARTLASLLEDREGVELFKRYVESEGGIHADRLNFYFACEGLKQQSDPEKVKLMIGAIYRFLRKSQLTIPEEIKRAIKLNLKNENQISSNIYDQMQKDVEKIINETTYPNFLRSDIYVQHVQNMQVGLGSACSGATGTCSVTSASYGYGGGGSSNPTSTSSSSGSCSAQEYLKRSSTLPTLHEDCELVCENLQELDVNEENSAPVGMPVKLTRDLLLATQKRRLEVRPPGDGGPYIPRRQSSMDNRIFRNAFTNRETDKFPFIPRTLRGEEKKKPFSPEELFNILLPKLEKIKRQQETTELFERKLQEGDMFTSERLVAANAQAQQPIKGKNLAEAIREKFQLDDDNDQAILDQHVSRVWSDLTPARSPGTMSPCPANANKRKGIYEKDHSTITNDLRFAEPSGLGHNFTMKHSKSMPDHNVSSKKLLSNKWPSMNTDSGISLFSADMLLKTKDQSSSRDINRPRGFPTEPPSMPNTAFQLEEARRRLEDESRRSKKHGQHTQPSTSATATLQKSSQDHTTVVFNFLEEEFPYRIKIPGLQPTLKQFKDYLPKKGNFRYFFKTICEELESSVIQEEIVNDTDLLPFFEGKIMGVVKPAE